MVPQFEERRHDVLEKICKAEREGEREMARGVRCEKVNKRHEACDWVTHSHFERNKEEEAGERKIIKDQRREEGSNEQRKREREKERERACESVSLYIHRSQR